MSRSRKGKRPVGDGEIKEIQRLKLENQKLKKQIASLRKQLNRIDIDRYQYIKDMLENQAEEDQQFEVDRELDDIKKHWECEVCARDYLRIIVIRKGNGVFYMRRCPTCMHKTKLKKFTHEVEGIDSEGQVYTKNYSFDDEDEQ